MKNLFIYHSGTGTLISLADPVYLVASDIAGEYAMEVMDSGVECYPDEHKGYRIDNYNMTNLFFGEE